MTEGVPRSVRSKPSAAVSVPDHEGTKIAKSVVIQKTVDEIFKALFRTEFVKFLLPVRSITPIKRGRYRWLLEIPSLGRPVEWIAEVIRDKPKRMFSWRTIDPSDVASAGSVWLSERSSGRGTEVRIILKYDIPNEFLNADFQKLFGKPPETVIHEGLRHFKSFMEAGEVPTVEGQTHGGQGVS